MSRSDIVEIYRSWIHVSSLTSSGEVSYSFWANPIEIEIQVGTVFLTIAVFDVPGNGDCVFSWLFIAWKSGLSSWQPCGKHFQVPVTIDVPLLPTGNSSSLKRPLALAKLYTFRGNGVPKLAWSHGLTLQKGGRRARLDYIHC